VTPFPSVVRSAIVHLVSFVTIPGELRSVRRHALNGSRRARRWTAAGYSGSLRLTGLARPLHRIERRRQHQPAPWQKRKGHLVPTPESDSSSPRRVEQVFVDAGPRAQPRPAHLPGRSTRRGQHRRTDPETWNPPRPRSAHTELLADIDGIPVLVRFLLADMPAEGQSEIAFRNINLHSALSTTVEKAVVRMGGSRLRRHAQAKQPLATVELIATAEHLAWLAARPDHTTLRVGPLELDLLDRTAKRGDRHIDLRPREFQLLKYMMQRSDILLTRASLLMEVWNYKFVPESNLVDVHMSMLRRKIDGPSEFPIIRNVRGIGFVLSSPPSSQTSISTTAEPTGARASGNVSGALERLLQW